MYDILYHGLTATVITANTAHSCHTL